MKFELALQLSLTSLIPTQILLPLKCDIITVVGKNMSHPVLSDEFHIHLQSVSLIEAKYHFFRHVRKVILEELEIRTLQSLLKEYMTVMEDYYHSACGVKPSFLKTLLIHEYGDSIGFHVRHQKNESEVVYD